MTGRLTQVGERFGSMTPSDEVLSIARRATVLVAWAGPYHPAAAAPLDRLPPGSRAARGLRSGVYVALTAGPQLALDRVAQTTLGGPPLTAEQIAKHRTVMLAGDAALVAIGLLGQTAINHSGRSGPVADLSRTVSAQIAIGAVAATIIVGSDVVLKPISQRPDMQAPASVAIGTVSRSVQRRLLRKAADVLLLPTRPKAFNFVG